MREIHVNNGPTLSVLVILINAATTNAYPLPTKKLNCSAKAIIEKTISEKPSCLSISWNKCKAKSEHLETEAAKMSVLHVELDPMKKTTKIGTMEEKQNPIKRFHFQWHRTFGYLVSDRHRIALRFSFRIVTVPSGGWRWKETNPMNHSLKSQRGISIFLAVISTRFVLLG